MSNVRSLGYPSQPRVYLRYNFDCNVEIAKIRESFALLTNMIKNRVPHELESSHDFHGEPTFQNRILESRRFPVGKNTSKQTMNITKNDVKNPNSRL